MRKSERKSDRKRERESEEREREREREREICRTGTETFYQSSLILKPSLSPKYRSQLRTTFMPKVRSLTNFVT